MSAARGHRRRPPRVRTAVGLLLGAAIVVAGALMALPALVGGPGAAGASGHVTATDMHGRSVRLDPGEVPVPRSASHARADTGARLVVPSVGLDVPLGALDAVDGRITPPGFRSAYLVRNEGVPPARAARGTVLVVMHSLRGGGVAPGNYLTDVAAQRSRVHAGAAVRVAGVRYRVTGSQLVAKSRLAGDHAIWADSPGRLLLITCLEHPDGSPSTDNLVVTATLDG